MHSFIHCSGNEAQRRFNLELFCGYLLDVKNKNLFGFPAVPLCVACVDQQVFVAIFLKTIIIGLLILSHF